MAGDWSADQRMAAFLLGLSQRLASRGFSPHRFQLTMARTDIGNYLRLAPETVSRVLKRFQDDGLIVVDRREVDLTTSPASRRSPRRSCTADPSRLTCVRAPAAALRNMTRIVRSTS